MSASVLLAFKMVIMRALTVMFSEKMLKWLLFYVLDLIVESTKTPKDNEWAKRFKDDYEESERAEAK